MVGVLRPTDVEGTETEKVVGVEAIPCSRGSAGSHLVGPVTYTHWVNAESS